MEKKTTRKINVIGLLTVSLLLFSCKSEIPDLFPEAITFNSEEVMSIHLKEGKRLELSPPMKITRFLVYDTLFIASGNSTVNNCLMHIYCLESGNLITSFAEQGRGPEEVMYAGRFQILPESNAIFFPDFNHRRTWTYSIDSLLNESNRAAIETVDFADSNYQIYLKLDNGYYIVRHYGVFREQGNEMLKKVSLPLFEPVEVVYYPQSYDRFEGIFGRHLWGILTMDLTYNPDRDIVLAVYKNFDLIEVYDSNLNRLVRIHGPERFYPVFSFASPMVIGGGGGVIETPSDIGGRPRSLRDNVTYPGGISRLGYGFGVPAKDGFYASFNGKIRPVNPQEWAYAETVYYFNYDGTPVCKYTFDIVEFSRIQVDDSQEKIYLTDPYGEVWVYDLRN